MSRSDTLVFQAWSGGGIAPWLRTCLASVAAWARRRGHDHVLLGDEFLRVLPDWYAARCGRERLPLTDLARLLWTRRYLAEGWPRVVWLDADVLVLVAHEFAIGSDAPHALGREYWLWHEPDGTLGTRWSITNCVTMFTKASSLLPFYIDACETIVRTVPQIHRLSLGPNFLTALSGAVPLPLVPDLATLSPVLIDAVAQGQDETVAAHAAGWNAPIRAVHLCRSLVVGAGGPALIDAARVETAVARLLAEPDLVNG